MEQIPRSTERISSCNLQEINLRGIETMELKILAHYSNCRVQYFHVFGAINRSHYKRNEQQSSIVSHTNNIKGPWPRSNSLAQFL